MNDKSLEQLFSAYQPTMSSEVDFLQKLEARLDVVEYIKQHQQAQAKRYRLALIVTFVIGFCMGAAATALIFSLPADIHLYTYGFNSAVFVFIEHNYRLLALLPSFALIAYLAYNIFQILKDIDLTRVALLRVFI